VLLVALTGYGSEDDRERALAAGFDDHVAKPIEPATLEALMSRIEERQNIMAVVPQLS
jgi:CheY-like chemotaxis protein